MYDEFERSLNSDRRSRSKVGTWILLGFAGFTCIGIAGAVAGFFAVRNEVERVVERVERIDVRVDGREIERALERIDRLDGLDKISGLENLAVANAPLGEALRAMAMYRNVEPELAGDNARSSRLRINAGGGEIFIGTGAHAGPPPAWVPAEAERPDDARQVFSARIDGGTFGAVSWKADADPEAIADAYRRALLQSDFTLRGEGTHEDAGARASVESGATVWAESADGGRHVFVVAVREAGKPTSVVLGYAERVGN